jgi:hypothetical protein
VVARGEPLPNFDFHARLLTLPGIFDSKPEGVPAEVPYLSVDASRVERIGRLIERSLEREGEAPAEPNLSSTNGSGSAGASPSQLMRPLRVGIVWQGNTAHKGDRFRSIPLAKFEPLARIPGIRLVSLQKGFGTEQIESCREAVPAAQWSDAADLTAEALLDTAAAMKNLDLVIAVDTSVAHLAGALGVPVWVAMPLASDWRWLLDREDTPWYPTMRLFRQRDLEEWDQVIARMSQALAERSKAMPCQIDDPTSDARAGNPHRLTSTAPFCQLPAQVA